MPNIPSDAWQLAGAKTEASISELEDRVVKAIEFIKAIKPAQIDGNEDKEMTMKFASGERKFSGQSLLLNFCLPNFYFHATTAYDILRQSGVELAAGFMERRHRPRHGDGAGALFNRVLCIRV